MRFIRNWLICVLLLLTFILYGCIPEWQTSCRHRALFSAWVVGEQYPVRIAVWKIGYGSWHSQAQAYYDNDWHWVSPIDDYTISETFQEYIPDDRTIGYWPMVYFTVEEFEKKIDPLQVDKKNKLK